MDGQLRDDAIGGVIEAVVADEVDIVDARDVGRRLDRDASSGLA